MSFDYEMVAHPEKALKASEDVETSLGKIESRAKQAGNAMTGAFDLGIPKMKASKDAVDNLARAMGSLVTQLKHEQEALQRINGPMQQAQADVRTLDQLYTKGQISVHQYIRELEKLGMTFKMIKGESTNVITAQKAAEALALKTISLPDPGKIKRGPGMLDRFAATPIGSVATAGGLMAAGRTAIAETDRWNGYTNALQKFATAAHPVSEILQSHVRLSHEMNSNMETTIQIYDGVEGATKDLAFTQRELELTTRTLGRSMVLDGKSIEQGASVMEGLELAMATGELTAKQYKATLKEFPDIAEMWASSLGKTTKETLDLAEAGKIGAPEIEKFMRSFATNAEDVDKKWAKQKKSISQNLHELWDDFSKPLPPLEVAQMQYELSKLTQSERDAMEATEKLDKSVKRLDDTMADINRKIAAADKAMSEQFTKSMKGLNDKLMENMFTGLDPSAASLHQRTEMQKWQEQFDDVEAVTAQYKSTADGLIKGPMRDYQITLEVINRLLADGRITQAQYNEEFMKLKAAIPTDDELSRIGRVGSRKLGSQTVSVGFEPGTSGGSTEARSLEDLGLDAAPDTAWMEKLIGDYDKLIEKQKVTNDLTREWRLQMQQMNADLSTRSVRGVEEGLAQIRDEVFNVNELISSSMTNTFHSLEDAMVKAATTGELSFGAMAEQIVADLTRIAFRMLLLSALQGMGVPGTALASIGFGGNHADGGSYTERRAGGADSQLVLFRMSTGETAHFTPEGQGGGGGAGGNVSIRNVYDRRALTANINTPDGKKEILNVMQSSPGAFRSILDR